jgi:small subunit ribosomal protein S28e
MAEEQQSKQYDGYLAEIVDIQPSRTGMFGSIMQVMCKIMEGKDKGRVIRRNISGRVKIGDIIRLGDTSREDKPINVK